MFDSCLDYRKINVFKKCESSYEYKIHSYSFYGKSGYRYIVYVEEYDYFVFVIKFCLAKHKNLKNKYCDLTGLNESPSILGTIISILRHSIKDNPYASLGFIGSHLPSEGFKNTKRFKLYSIISANFASPINFTHYHSTRISAYLLLNKHNTEDRLLKKVIDNFSNIYNNIDESVLD